SPSQDAATEAAGRLLSLLDDFPFADDVHKAVWLAALLTGFAMEAVDGPKPLFLFGASAAGSGKTLLASLIGLILTGRDLAASGLSDNDEEVRKDITSILLAGDRVILFDNASGSFGCKSLDSVLTKTTWEDRILGKSERTPSLPNKTLWLATGNNLRLVGDTHRRVIPCRLEPACERPEERTGFRIPDLVGHVRRSQPRLARLPSFLHLSHVWLELDTGWRPAIR